MKGWQPLGDWGLSWWPLEEEEEALRAAQISSICARLSHAAVPSTLFIAQISLICSDILNLRPSVTCLVLHHLIHRSDILNLFRYLHAQISHAQISHTQMSSIYACLSHATASSTLFIAQIWIAVFPIRAIHNLLLHAACSDILNLRPSVTCCCTIHLIHSSDIPNLLRYPQFAPVCHMPSTAPPYS